MFKTGRQEWRFLTTSRKNRCIHDIVYEILTVLQRNGEMRKTALCLSANLPMDRCTSVLKLLGSYGLICETPDKRVKLYRICERGYMYLGLYVKLRETLPYLKQGRR